MKEQDVRTAMALSLCQGVGSASFNLLLNEVELGDIFSLSLSDLISIGVRPQTAQQILFPDWQAVDKTMQYCAKNEIQIMTLPDNTYPHYLKQISHAPLTLFCRGNADLLHRPQIAIVGSRNVTPTGKEIARQFAIQLAQTGLTITSGGALGVDGEAHRGALEAQGKTIAVLGSGVDVYYPRRHQMLFEKIAAQGALVSEFFPGTRPHSSHFPRRNRIISGLSLGVLIVEAEIKSGSLITARYAMEQNKEVFAVPGSILSSLSQGCHFLIKQGAKLTESVNDIFEEVSFFCENSLYSIESINKKEPECPILQQIGFEATSIETITQRIQWPVEDVMARLLDLELENKVQRVQDGYIKLARG